MTSYKSKLVKSTESLLGEGQSFAASRQIDENDLINPSQNVPSPISRISDCDIGRTCMWLECGKCCLLYLVPIRENGWKAFLL